MPLIRIYNPLFHRSATFITLSCMVICVHLLSYEIVNFLKTGWLPEEMEVGELSEKGEGF